jgi:hypothetical protein
LKPHPDTSQFVERVRCFINWHEDRFDALDKPHKTISDPVGWTRGGEHWIRPDIWRDTIFDGDEDEGVNAARVLRDLGLLRTQDSRNCQAVVCVRDRKSARAYVVKPGIQEWRHTAPAYGAYDAAQIGLPYSDDNGSPALISLSFDGSPPDLANKLEAATSLALDEVLNILRIETQPDDRSFQAILRAKSGIINTVISNQVRVDEAKLKNSQHNDVLPQLLAKIDQSLKEHAEKEKEDARKAREEGWADNTVSDELAAKIYHERTSPWVARFNPAARSPQHAKI